MAERAEAEARAAAVAEAGTVGAGAVAASEAGAGAAGAGAVETGSDDAGHVEVGAPKAPGRPPADEAPTPDPSEAAWLPGPVPVTADRPTASEPRPAPDTSAGVPANGSCPLLRRLDEGGRLEAPLPDADSWHRCAAETPPGPLSDQQQTLVCLTESHVDCPRYVRAAAPLPAPAATRPAPRVSAATIAATIVLVMSFLAALSYVVVNGGIGVPTPPPSGGIGAVSPGGSATPASNPATSPQELPSPSPAASSSLAASPETSPSPVSTPTPSAPPVASPSAAGPSPSSDRYLLLTACPSKPACYLYTVRRGDNLTSIGLYFGVPFDTILALNPGIKDPARIRAGTVVVLPPPTR